MLNRYGLLIAFVILVATNAILFGIWRGRVNDLSLVRGNLDEYFGIKAYIKDHTLVQSPFLLRNDRWDTILYASKLFSEKLDSLLVYRRELKISRAGTLEYFKCNISVDKKHQAVLVSAHENYQKAIARFLKVDEPVAREEFIRQKDYVQSQLTLIENEARKGPEGVSKSMDFRRSPSGKGLSISWIKVGDSILWDSNWNWKYFQSYFLKLEKRVNSPYAIKTREALTKLARVFPATGEVVIFQNSI